MTGKGMKQKDSAGAGSKLSSLGGCVEDCILLGGKPAIGGERGFDGSKRRHVPRFSSLWRWKTGATLSELGTSGCGDALALYTNDQAAFLIGCAVRCVFRTEAM